MKKTETYHLNDCINFGKYRGETMRNIIDNHKPYIQWLLKNVATFVMAEDSMMYYQGLNYDDNSEEIETLDFFPFRDIKKARERFINYARETAEDAQIVTDITTTEPIQLTLF